MANDTEKFFPISDSWREKLSNKDKCNFSLYSPRMVYWKLDPKKCTVTVSEDVMNSLKNQSDKSLSPSAISNFIERKNKMLDAYIESLKEQGIQTFTFKTETASPFITGLGSGHPTETGITLDRNIGVPYLPATSIKGVLRVARAINIAEKRDDSYGEKRFEVNDKELADYFGYGAEEDKDSFRGQFVILDAYPSGRINLDVDIINPHFGKYYKGDTTKQPMETETPIPVKFLTVPTGKKFTFRCAYIPLNKEDKCNEEDVKAMFKTAFETVGFGAKTAIGYGRFKEIE